MWTPADLFMSGEQGAWYDPSDLFSLWQDAAGTVQVVNTGDPVRCIDDKSGNGSHLIISSGDYPTYETLNGFPAVYTPGGWRNPTTVGSVGITNVTFVAIAARNDQALFSGGALFNGVNDHSTDILNGIDNDINLGDFSDTVINKRTNGVPYAAAEDWPGPMVDTSGGGGQGLQGPAVVTCSVATIAGTKHYSLFGDPTTFNDFWKGHMLGLIVLDRYPSETELALIEQWLADKCGAVLENPVQLGQQIRGRVVVAPTLRVKFES